MPLAQNATVALRPVRLLRAVAQHVVVEHAEDFDRRHRGADVAALAADERVDDQTAQIDRARIKREALRTAGKGD